MTATTESTRDLLARHHKAAATRFEAAKSRFLETAAINPTQAIEGGRAVVETQAAFALWSLAIEVFDHALSNRTFEDLPAEENLHRWARSEIRRAAEAILYRCPFASAARSHAAHARMLAARELADVLSN